MPRGVDIQKPRSCAKAEDRAQVPRRELLDARHTMDGRRVKEQRIAGTHSNVARPVAEYDVAAEHVHELEAFLRQRDGLSLRSVQLHQAWRDAHTARQQMTEQFIASRGSRLRAFHHDTATGWYMQEVDALGALREKLRD